MPDYDDKPHIRVAWEDSDESNIFALLARAGHEVAFMAERRMTYRVLNEARTFGEALDIIEEFVTIDNHPGRVPEEDGPGWNHPAYAGRVHPQPQPEIVVIDPDKLLDSIDAVLSSDGDGTDPNPEDAS